jgi:hypothetical protein
VDEDGINTTDGMFRLGSLTRSNDDRVVAAADVSALGDDVKGGPISVGWE